jgi:hypothetical protein
MINATSASIMEFAADPTRRNFLCQIIAAVGATASAVTTNRVTIAIYNMNQIGNMDEANTLRIVPSRLYVPLSPQHLTEAREILSKQLS